MKAIPHSIFTAILLIVLVHGVNGQLLKKNTVIKNVIVIDRKGAEIKERADRNSATLGIYHFGASLDVIEENEEWYGVSDRVTREMDKGGSTVETSTRWEKVYVLKSQTGSINDVILIPSDLNIVSSLTLNENIEYFEAGKPLEGYLKIELVDKDVFQSERSSAINFLFADTTAVKKNRGVIKLKCKSKVVKYKDKPEKEERSQVFHYVGQIDFLDKYLIGGMYYERIDYRFIDRTTGEETQYFGDYPTISADKKHIICIYNNPYESTADLELYSINVKQIKHIMSASFVNWVPTVDTGEMFWSTDGYLYLTVYPSSSYGQHDGSADDKFQYIRIKVL